RRRQRIPRPLSATQTAASADGAGGEGGHGSTANGWRPCRTRRAAGATSRRSPRPRQRRRRAGEGTVQSGRICGRAVRSWAGSTGSEPAGRERTGRGGRGRQRHSWGTTSCAGNRPGQGRFGGRNRRPWRHTRAEATEVGARHRGRVEPALGQVVQTATAPAFLI